MIHYLNLHNDPFISIKSGKKTVEMRLNDERRQSITIGDILVFTNNDTKEKISVEVLDKQVFPNFSELYKAYNKIEIGYEEDEIADPNDMSKYYSQEKMDKYGALAIRITLLKNYVVVFDMDDTLLSDEKTVSDYSLNILKTLQEMGHKVVMNTARSKYYNSEYFKLVKPDYAILNGGALIIDKEENVVYKSVFDVNKIEEIIKEFLKYTRIFSLQTENDFLTNNIEYKGQNAKYFDFSKEYFRDECYKIVASFINLEDAFKVGEKFNLEVVPYFDGKFVRFNNKGISKLSGNIELSKILNVNLDDFIVFGDDIGDLEMIENCGEGVLMLNSNIFEKYPNILKAEYSNNEDGVCKYLDKKFKISAKPH